MSDQQLNSCQSCKHFWKVPTPSGVVQLGEMRGQCRALPPIATVFVDQRGAVVGQAAAFPQLPPEHPRCGMHELKEAL